MKKIVLVCAVALCPLAAASTAHAQYWPSSSYSYYVYPGGGYYNYNVSNWYAAVHAYQSFGYGSVYRSYSYNGPYGNYSWWQNSFAPAYYNYNYPVYQYHHHHPAHRWYYYHRR